MRSCSGTASADPGARSIPRGAGGALIPRRVALLANRKADQAGPKEQQAGDGEGEVVGPCEVVQQAPELDAQGTANLMPREGETVEDAEMLQAIDLRRQRTSALSI
jgi:hypothetical protein